MANIPDFVAALINAPPNDPNFWRISNPVAAAANEGGIDIPNAGGTPVYALETGPLESSHLFWHNPPDVTQPLGGNPGYGVVSERVNVPGFGLEDIYYQHIDINPNLPSCLGGNCSNYIVQKGQLLGWTRADVGEIEVGVNPQNWGPVWGPDQHPGPWVDPEGMIRALVGENPNYKWGSQIGGGNVPATNQTGSCSVTDWIKCTLFTQSITNDPTCLKCGLSGAISQSPVGQTGPIAQQANSILSSELAMLANPQTWIVLGLVLFGAIVIIVGLAKMIE